MIELIAENQEVKIYQHNTVGGRIDVRVKENSSSE